MSLRFFVDQCISNYVIQTLRNAGHEVFRLRDHISPDSSDLAVISKAMELNCILVSLDGDFTDIVIYPPKKYMGIISLQIKNHPEVTPQVMERLNKYLSSHPEMNHYKGKLLIIEAHRIRIRGYS